MGLNRWEGIGNLGSDPDMRYTQSGEPVANFSLACNERYNDKNTGEQKEVTEWVNCVAFGRRAEVIQEYCKKGSKLFVEGKLRTRKWQDKDGIDKYTTEVILSGFQFLDSKGSGSPQPRSANSGARTHAPVHSPQPRSAHTNASAHSGAQAKHAVNALTNDDIPF
jgi:single-strand DNA-binding protein